MPSLGTTYSRGGNVRNNPLHFLQWLNLTMFASCQVTQYLTALFHLADYYLNTYFSNDKPNQYISKQWKYTKKQRK